MPIAIVMSESGAIPALLMEDTEQDLANALNGLQEARDIQSPADARTWLQSLPAPSGWFGTIEEAKAHLQRYRDQAPILPGAVVREARERLNLGRAEFAAELGYGGNPNTRHKTMFEIENESTSRSGKPMVLNPTATLRLKALLAERGLEEMMKD